jgi:hypothetical protein
VEFSVVFPAKFGFIFWFLGAFAKLQTATVTFVFFACPFVCMEQVGSHWTDFNEI